MSTKAVADPTTSIGYVYKFDEVENKAILIVNELLSQDSTTKSTREYCPNFYIVDSDRIMFSIKTQQLVYYYNNSNVPIIIGPANLNNIHFPTLAVIAEYMTKWILTRL